MEERWNNIGDLKSGTKDKIWLHEFSHSLRWVDSKKRVTQEASEKSTDWARY